MTAEPQMPSPVDKALIEAGAFAPLAAHRSHN